MTILLFNHLCIGELGTVDNAPVVDVGDFFQVGNRCIIEISRQTDTCAWRNRNSSSHRQLKQTATVLLPPVLMDIDYCRALRAYGCSSIPTRMSSALVVIALILLGNYQFATHSLVTSWLSGRFRHYNPPNFLRNPKLG